MDSEIGVRHGDSPLVGLAKTHQSQIVIFAVLSLSLFSPSLLLGFVLWILRGFDNVLKPIYTTFPKCGTSCS